jgi:hypothetical protein
VAFDEDGFGYVANSDEPGKEFEASCFLQRQVFEVESSKRRVLVNVAPGPKQKIFLDTQARAYHSRQASFRVGPCKGRHDFAFVVCERPRGGFKTFYSFVGLCQGLGLNMYKGRPSRWAFQQMPSSEKFMRQLCHDQVVRSMGYSSEGQVDDGNSRVFPSMPCPRLQWSA